MAIPNTLESIDLWAEVPPAEKGRKFDRFAMVSRERIAELSQVDSRAVAFILLFDFSVIAAAIVLSERYWSIYGYLVAVAIIGARQIGVAIVALHDGAHGLLFSNRRANDIVAKILTESLFIAVLGLEFSRYRKSHFEHHRHTNREADPDERFFANWFASTRGQRIKALLLSLSGVVFAQLTFGLLRRVSWTRRLLIFVGVALVAGGLWWNVYLARLLVLYWLVPFATWGLFVNSFRAVTEHYPPGVYETHSEVPELFRTRDIRPTWFDVLFVVTRGGINYHLTHHLFPSVPFFRLGVLHREIAESQIYRRCAHVTQGYHRVFMEVIFGQ